MTRRLPLAALATAGLILTACTPPADDNSPSDTNSTGETTLTIYSNSLSDGRDQWLLDQAQEAGFKLQLVDLGGGDIQNRLIAEKNAPIADVTFGLNNVYFNRLKNEGLLESYTPSWSSEVDQSQGDADGDFWPIVTEPIMLICNDDAPAKADSWPQLWQDDTFHNHYEVAPNLNGATTQMVLTGILSQHKSDNGDLGVDDAGWDAIKQYYEYGSKATKGVDLFARMKEGDIYCGQMWLAGKASREKQYGIKTTAAHPSNGVPMVTQQIGLIKNSKNTDEAKKFIDWFGSAEVQGQWSQNFFTAPANKKAQEIGDQDAISVTNSFTPQDIDWAWVTTYLPEWMKKIELQYMK